jgi:hypothetical protein
MNEQTKSGFDTFFSFVLPVRKQNRSEESASSPTMHRPSHDAADDDADYDEYEDEHYFDGVAQDAEITEEAKRWKDNVQQNLDAVNTQFRLLQPLLRDPDRQKQMQAESLVKRLTRWRIQLQLSQEHIDKIIGSAASVEEALSRLRNEVILPDAKSLLNTKQEIADLTAFRHYYYY